MAGEQVPAQTWHQCHQSLAEVSSVKESGANSAVESTPIEERWVPRRDPSASSSRDLAVALARGPERSAHRTADEETS